MGRFSHKIGEASDEGKFQGLYEKYCKMLYYVAYRILKNREDAEDAVQDAFLRVYRNISKITDPYCPETRALLYIIVRNVSFTMLKKKKHVGITSLSDVSRESSPEAGPLESSIANNTIQIIVEVIRELPERYRDCMYLELVQEFSCKEIASMLGEKEGTIRKRIQRGRKLLRQRLEEKGVFYED